MKKFFSSENSQTILKIAGFALAIASGFGLLPDTGFGMYDLPMPIF